MKGIFLNNLNYNFLESIRKNLTNVRIKLMNNETFHASFDNLLLIHENQHLNQQLKGFIKSAATAAATTTTSDTLIDADSSFNSLILENNNALNISKQLHNRRQKKIEDNYHQQQQQEESEAETEEEADEEEEIKIDLEELSISTMRTRTPQTSSSSSSSNSSTKSIDTSNNNNNDEKKRIRDDNNKSDIQFQEDLKELDEKIFKVKQLLESINK